MPVEPAADLVARGFIPFAFGAADNLDALDPRPLGLTLHRVAAERPEATPMHRLLLRLNALAFGGLGMPAWVQLDLCALPSAFVGWALPRAQVPAGLSARLGVTDEPLVPVAEALAVPTLVPGRVMSCSLASVLPGHHLALHAKRLGLAALRATESWGLAQYDNASLRTHTRFGPLHIVQPWMPMHERAETSFLYRLDLRAPADGPHQEPDLLLDPADPASLSGLRQLHADGHALAVLAPGRVHTPAGPRTPIAVSGSDRQA